MATQKVKSKQNKSRIPEDTAFPCIAVQVVHKICAVFRGGTGWWRHPPLEEEGREVPQGLWPSVRHSTLSYVFL